VDGEIDSVKAALALGADGKYLGKTGDALQAYLDRLLVEKQQLRDKEADLRAERKDLLVKSDEKPVTATTGECSMAQVYCIKRPVEISGATSSAGMSLLTHKSDEACTQCCL
jgi:hypothetical protein